ncbi:MAG TPA: pyruvate kinase [Porticoccaceae bacterium]|nr:pyruvate kinase [Porticoccaceae bacterium]
MATNGLEPEVLGRLYDELIGLREWICVESSNLLKTASDFQSEASCSPSCINLAHYLALRERELRPLQNQLAELALSSLGRSEAHVMDTLETLIQLLALALNRSTPTLDQTPASFEEGGRLLARNIERLFGPLSNRPVHVMVTLPVEAAQNHDLIDALLAAGATCFRINCAHDSPRHWRAMISGIRAAEQHHGRRCAVEMDLAGPKLRTGTIANFPRKIKLRRRNNPADPEAVPDNLLVTDQPHRLGDYTGIAMFLEPGFFPLLEVGDCLRFRDCRNNNRQLKLHEKIDEKSFLASCERTAVIDGSTQIELLKQHLSEKPASSCVCPRGFFDGAKPPRLMRGDLFLLVDSAAAKHGMEGDVPLIPRIEIQVPEVLDRLPVGIKIWFDDGKLGGYVESITADGLRIRIDHAPAKGARLGPDKGINVPGVDLGLSVLDSKDLRDLDFVVEHADLVGLSYTEKQEDVDRLVEEMDKRGVHLPIVIKIETGRGLANLPRILLNMLDRHPLAVMIARGDLAVEVGGERMAEIQEELLWLCEAAHLPVIWATQVMETLVKRGELSRPEMTDASVSGRADCVMLNKGPFIVAGVRVLNDILLRMRSHQQKKTARLRALRWSAQSK